MGVRLTCEQQMCGLSVATDKTSATVHPGQQLWVQIRSAAVGTNCYCKGQVTWGVCSNIHLVGVGYADRQRVLLMVLMFRA